MSTLPILILSLGMTVHLWGQAPDLLSEAESAFRSGDLSQAALLASRILAREPGSSAAHMILGVIAAQSSQWLAAEKSFGAVIRLEPSNPFGYFYLGQVSLNQQKWAKAVQYFSQAMEHEYPDRDRLMVELALAENEAGQPQQALESLNKIRTPGDGSFSAQYHAVKAFALEKLNQPGPAIDDMRQARDIDDSNPQYWEFLISTLIATDQTNLALMEAIRAQRKFPDAPDIQVLLGLAGYYNAQLPMTKLALRNLEETQPDSAWAPLLKGLQDRLEGRAPDAQRAFTEAARRGVPNAHLLLGIVSRESGDYAAAEREYREAERLNPHDGQARLELGKLLLARGDLNGALTRLERAAQYMPAAPAAHYQLGILYGRLGQKEKGEEQMRLWRQLTKEQAEAAR
jgi:tetratricopeptide (TPR) repeat protein